MENGISQKVLEEIEKRNTIVTPRWLVFLKRFSFWLLAFLSIISGSIAMATAIYVFFDNDFAVDHNTINQLFLERPLIADIILSIPYIWLAALLLFMLVAFLGFRHTKTGYRYAALKVIAISLVTSFLLSLGMNTVDVGLYIHRYLIENVHGYHHVIYANEHRWTNARKGLLSGKVIVLEHDKRTLVVKDFKQNLWRVAISHADIHPKTRIVVGQYLKIRGMSTGEKTFQATEIQHWEKKYKKRNVVQP